MKILWPHARIMLDLRWIAVHVGVGYYDLARDTFRPAFVDVIVWEKWRVSFEAGRTSPLYR